MTTTEYPEFPGVESFLLGSGLYAIYAMQSKNDAINLFGGSWRIDGHCVHCRQKTIFRRSSSFQDYDQKRLNEGKAFRDSVEISCARNSTHTIWFEIDMVSLKVQKIGQLPSLATIANDESRIYYKTLGSHDAKEFSKALGLATHGVGIGSFVYLRRIFERLVNARFEQFKKSETWTGEQVRNIRMDEKIELIKDHLPGFLVKNRGIYGILSQGIHELEDEQCLAFFPILKASILIILEEDKKKQEEINRQKELERAIQSLNTKPMGSQKSVDSEPI